MAQWQNNRESRDGDSLRFGRRTHLTITCFFALLLSAPLVARVANAEDADFKPLMPELSLADDAPPPEAGKTSNWKYRLNLGATAALGSSTNVIGQQNGISATIGAQIDAGADWRKDLSEWRNSLRLSEAFTRSPPIDTFIKANDLLSIETMYLRTLKKIRWLGLFARLQVDLPLLPGYDVRDGGGILYVASRRDGSDEQRFRSPTDADVTKKKLSDAGLPLTLRESMGPFARPFDSDAFRLEVKAGVGGLQTFSKDQFAVDDDDSTDEVELVILDNIFQAGPVVGIELRGALANKGFNYYFLAEALMPVINNRRSTDDRGVAELTNWLVEGGFSLKLVSWASLDYQLKVFRQPQLLDQVQVLNNLLLTFSYTLLDSEAEAAPEVTPAAEQG